MSRFRKLSHTIWHCQYHVVFVPKYRFRVLEGEIAVEVENCIKLFSSQKECEIVELNIQIKSSNRGNGMWKLNSSIIQEPEYNKNIRELIEREWQTSNIVNQGIRFDWLKHCSNLLNIA